MHATRLAKLPASFTAEDLENQTLTHQSTVTPPAAPALDLVVEAKVLGAYVAKQLPKMTEPQFAHYNAAMRALHRAQPQLRSGQLLAATQVALGVKQQQEIHLGLHDYDEGLISGLLKGAADQAQPPAANLAPVRDVAGPSPEPAALAFAAVERDDVSALSALLDGGVSVDAKRSPPEIQLNDTSYSEPLLFVAAKSGATAAAAELMRRGPTKISALTAVSNALLTHFKHESALEAAAAAGHTEVVRILLTRPRIWGAYRRNALELAIRHGHHAIATLLLPHTPLNGMQRTKVRALIQKYGPAELLAQLPA